MKKLNIKYLIALWMCAPFFLVSCDKGFEEENTNPDASTDVEPEYMFTKSVYDALNNSTGTVYEFSAGGFVQHFATYLEVPGLGDKYVYTSGTYPYAYFSGAYVNAVNEIEKVVLALEEDESKTNMHAIASIWKVYVYHRITDLYGMIPYSEAATAYTQSNYSPAYDTQEAIYTNMLETLQSAANAFDSSKTSFGSGDLIYGGDTGKWKKFAYSLMLRLAMRMTKVDATAAQTWAQTAISGGVIENISDEAILPYVGGQEINSNPISFQLRNNNYSQSNGGSSNTEGGKFSATFISHLRENNDPRLTSVAAVWVNGVQDTTTSIQQGMPNGLVNKPADFGSLSEPNLNTLLSLTASLTVVGSAEMNLLLAENAARGWISAEPATYYEKAITNAMSNMGNLYGNAAAISSDKIQDYIDSHPLPSSFEAQMETIHTEFWVSVFPDEIEVYSNWRRTGYPELTPVSVTGNLTNGTIPRRLTYPPSEISVNTESYEEAIGIQGTDTFVTRIWWDVE
ncbi:SusD/RagB family nutrient-binding outer membrane lipoprotein [Sinomicrobium oceani]|uniref:SusD/RagB family nutrient-binding outer membrane lipoprotein n=1 Tax=Sinomicrobium oceani TaxID=1150368 RepID=UPI00227A7A90|nr:SusD/RagB family nutrient-binding outer membrane lipoprotein [Sinomicrobium oceani]